MCWQCDHPGATWQDYIEHVRAVLADCCFFVQGVQRDRRRPPYAYTVGLTGHDRPELVVTGMPFGRAEDVLGGAAGHLLHARAPRPGEVIPLIGGPVAEVVLVAEPTVHFPVATAVYGPKVRALQLAWTDDRGHWPWERGFRGGRGGQPVLGMRAVQAA